MGFAEPNRAFVIKWAWASLISNTVIIITGGLVRLTGSGLGCPTWPQCTEESFVPHGALGVHGAIEFGNRLLTYVLVAVAVATFIAVLKFRDSDRGDKALAGALLVGIPLQAVIGGITVLTDLNPWIVAAHLILSMILVAFAVLLIARMSQWETAEVNGPVKKLLWLLVVVSALVVYLGTIVTGSGPHAGDANAPRNGLDPEAVSQIHASSVYLFIGLAIGVFVVFTVLQHPGLRAAKILLAVIAGQGLIGYVQYALGLPIAIVAAHLLGAAVTVAATTAVYASTLSTRSRELTESSETQSFA